MDDTSVFTPFRVADEIEQAKVLDATDIANQISPNRKLITSDMRAVQQGTWAPPHIKVQARVTAAHQPAAHCRDLAGRLEKLAAHLARIKQREVRAAESEQTFSLVMDALQPGGTSRTLSRTDFVCRTMNSIACRSLVSPT